MSIKEVRELALTYNVDEIERCIRILLETGENVCHLEGDSQEILSTLAKAETVRKLMDDGLDSAEAVRELARRIRRLQANQ